MCTVDSYGWKSTQRISKTTQHTSNHSKWSAEPTSTDRSIFIHFFSFSLLKSGKIGQIFIEILEQLEHIWFGHRSSMDFRRIQIWSKNSQNISPRNKSINCAAREYLHHFILLRHFGLFVTIVRSLFTQIKFHTKKINQCHNKTPGTWTTPNLSELPAFRLSIASVLLFPFYHEINETEEIGMGKPT